MHRQPGPSQPPRFIVRMPARTSQQQQQPHQATVRYVLPVQQQGQNRHRVIYLEANPSQSQKVVYQQPQQAAQSTQHQVVQRQPVAQPQIRQRIIYRDGAQPQVIHRQSSQQQLRPRLRAAQPYLRSRVAQQNVRVPQQQQQRMVSQQVQFVQQQPATAAHGPPTRSGSFAYVRTRVPAISTLDDVAIPPAVLNEKFVRSFMMPKLQNKELLPVLSDAFVCASLPRNASGPIAALPGAVNLPSSSVKLFAEGYNQPVATIGSDDMCKIKTEAFSEKFERHMMQGRPVTLRKDERTGHFHIIAGDITNAADLQSPSATLQYAVIPRSQPNYVYDEAPPRLSYQGPSAVNTALVKM